MRFRSAATAGLVLTLLLAPAPAQASCAPATPAELFAGADLVLYGQVAQQTHPMRQGGTDSRFAVESVLKGEAGPFFTIWEPSGPAPFPQGLMGGGVASSVDVGYQRGQRYILFANRSPEGWRSSACSGTRPMASLTAGGLAAVGLGELATHLPGKPPNPALPDPGEGATTNRWAGLLGWTSAGLLLLLALVAIRRAKARTHRGG